MVHLFHVSTPYTQCVSVTVVSATCPSSSMLCVRVRVSFFKQIQALPLLSLLYTLKGGFPTHLQLRQVAVIRGVCTGDVRPGVVVG